MSENVAMIPSANSAGSARTIFIRLELLGFQQRVNEIHGERDCHVGEQLEHGHSIFPSRANAMTMPCVTA